MGEWVNGCIGNQRFIQMSENISQTISRFLSVFSDTTSSEEEAITNFMAILDELAALSHHIHFKFDTAEYPDPPASILPFNLLEAVRTRFPSLGLYNVADNISDHIGESEIIIGDAIDDITDILSDLAEVRWYFENTSEANALFYYRLGFQTHWGRHLRELQLYLHDFRF